MKHTVDDLRQMQSLPLSVKVQMTKQRIRDFVREFDSYISFSGGKDSTVLLHIVREIYPDIPAVFVDTGLEFPEIKQFVKRFDNVTILRPEMSFRQVILKYGYPLISKEVAQKIYEVRKYPHCKREEYFDENSPTIQKYGKRYSLARWKWLKDSDIPISSLCCDVMKKKPVKKYEKKNDIHPIVGTMAEESQVRKAQWCKTGCNTFDGKRPMSKPMSFWTEQDVLRYIKENNIEICSVYGEIYEDHDGIFHTTGKRRTGCVFCGFGCHLEKEPNRFQRLKETHPKLWEYCMKPIEEGGLGMREPLERIGVKVDDGDQTRLF